MLKRERAMEHHHVVPARVILAVGLVAGIGLTMGTTAALVLHSYRSEFVPCAIALTADFVAGFGILAYLEPLLRR